MLSGLSEIADAYDLFLVDQWGVLHDGVTPYPGAVAALRHLRALGRPIVILSNSARRAHVGMEKMDSIGIPRDLYDRLITSGELTWRALRERSDPFYAGLGRRCLLISWGDDRGLTRGGVELETVDDVADAEFVLMAGTNRETLDHYEPMLQAARARNLPMVCANPDFVSVTPEGDLVICPGAVARRYEEIGGTVRWQGKPDVSVYEICRALYPEARYPLGIGDSLHHDIAGARAAGIDSLFVAGGIHAPDLGIVRGETPSDERLEALFAAIGQRPDHVIPTFRW
ncbi:MAG: TIGR01459 family HAD-type hydrolase [Rhodospirillales bacterium]|nr:MAG: TIGR01459 family HAD-type hydrolase [Rhodospirillales bacterium]